VIDQPIGSESGPSGQPSVARDLPPGPDAPLVPRFPIRFREVSILTVFYRTEPAATERLLPSPLRPAGEIAAVHIYRMGDVERMGAVNECNVMIPATLDRPDGPITGGYTVAQFVTSDVALAHGREVHGQPKKLARITLETRGDLWVGVVERNGIEIVTATLPYKQRVADRAELMSRFDFSLNFNLKAIRHIDGRPAIWEITARRLTDVELFGCWSGPCTVELRANAQAPVWRLPVVEPLEGFLWQTEFSLVGGERLHDFLAEPAQLS
jgi:acetoacetate decarboxylase